MRERRDCESGTLAATFRRVDRASTIVEIYLNRKACCSCSDRIGPARLEIVAVGTHPVGPSTPCRCERYDSRREQSCPANNSSLVAFGV